MGEVVHPFLCWSHICLFSELSAEFLDLFWLIFQVSYWCVSSQILGTLFFIYLLGGMQGTVYSPSQAKDEAHSHDGSRDSLSGPRAAVAALAAAHVTAWSREC